MNEYEGIVEVRETGMRMVNVFLDHGYRFLGAFVTSREVALMNGSYAMKRGLTYVVGRTADVDTISIDTLKAMATIPSMYKRSDEAAQ